MKPACPSRPHGGGPRTGVRTRLPWAVALTVQLGVAGLLPAAMPVQAAEHEVEVLGYAYQPPILRIHVGDTVTWVNREKRVSHSVLFEGSGEESERFFPGERWSRVFETPGEYGYRCGPHPEMYGLIVVEAAGGTPAADAD